MKKQQPDAPPAPFTSWVNVWEVVFATRPKQYRFEFSETEGISRNDCKLKAFDEIYPSLPTDRQKRQIIKHVPVLMETLEFIAALNNLPTKAIGI